MFTLRWISFLKATVIVREGCGIHVGVGSRWKAGQLEETCSNSELDETGSRVPECGDHKEDRNTQGKRQLVKDGTTAERLPRRLNSRKGEGDRVTPTQVFETICVVLLLGCDGENIPIRNKLTEMITRKANQESRRNHLTLAPLSPPTLEKYSGIHFHTWVQVSYVTWQRETDWVSEWAGTPALSQPGGAERPVCCAESETSEGGIGDMSAPISTGTLQLTRTSWIKTRHEFADATKPGESEDCKAGWERRLFPTQGWYAVRSRGSACVPEGPSEHMAPASTEDSHSDQAMGGEDSTSAVTDCPGKATRGVVWAQLAFKSQDGCICNGRGRLLAMQELAGATLKHSLKLSLCQGPHNTERHAID
ncbi:hypothetical protein chiPu_0022048 [Chiloscyllium punctatum]|uniref:Uncharacterized protein n=1 Tax=Chiloscyllium punctatum TaxID=137246 RepID=A0A401RIH2_CHIPU|nr:hypothetical protein [Chiloscyllium punctatum]